MLTPEETAVLCAGRSVPELGRWGALYDDVQKRLYGGLVARRLLRAVVTPHPDERLEILHSETTPEGRRAVREAA